MKPYRKVSEPWTDHLNDVQDGSIEAGLLLLSAIARPGQCLPHKKIAKVCGCSHGLIVLIEQKALRKIRHTLRKDFGMTLPEFLGTTTKDI